MSSHVERMLVNLRIVGSVEPFQKLNTKSGDHLVIEDGGWGSGSLARWSRGDGRGNSLKRLNELFDAVQAALLDSNVDAQSRARLRAYASKASTGLRNLRQTYEADVTTTAHYDVLIERVECILSGDQDQDQDQDVEVEEETASTASM